jgi:hypothetical protein
VVGEMTAALEVERLAAGLGKDSGLVGKTAAVMAGETTAAVAENGQLLLRN